jgi:hypothetical protein
MHRSVMLSVVVVDGFLPKQIAEKIEEALEGCTVHITYVDPQDDIVHLRRKNPGLGDIEL